MTTQHRIQPMASDAAEKYQNTSCCKCDNFGTLASDAAGKYQNTSRSKCDNFGTFIDISCNLTDPQFQGIYRDKKRHESDIEAVIQRAVSIGMQKLVCVCGSLQECNEAIRLANQLDPNGKFIFITVGVHPTRCSEFESFGVEEYFNGLRRMVSENQKRVIAIGEIGLDYDRIKFCQKEVQLRFFEAQLQLAEECQLPLLLHMRAACDDFCDILKRNGPKYDGVVHSFTGDINDLNQLLELGLYIGANGCSLKTTDNIDAVKAIPLKRLVLETDSPWCGLRGTHESSKFMSPQTTNLLNVEVVKTPQKWRKGCVVKDRNEPWNIVQVAEAVYNARIGVTEFRYTMGANREEFVQFCQRIVENTLDVFPKMK